MLRGIITACTEKHLQINKMEQNLDARKQYENGQNTTMISSVERALCKTLVIMLRNLKKRKQEYTLAVVN